MGFFASNDPKYRCCCNSCPSTKGAIVVGCLNFLFCGSQISFATYNFVYMLTIGASWEPVVISSIFGGFVIISVVLMMVGISQQRPSLLIPHLVAQVMGVTLLGVFVILCVVVIVAKPATVEQLIGQRHQMKSKSTLITLIVVCSLMFLLEIWFFHVCRSAYRYVKDKRDAEDIDYISPEQIPMTSISGNFNLY